MNKSDRTPPPPIADFPPAKKRGRPPKFTPSMAGHVAELAASGATDFEIAAKLEISHSTLNEWKKSNTAFSDTLKAGKRFADERVEKSLFNRAIGFTDPNGDYHPPHPTAAIFWLKNRKPADWRDAIRAEITGADGGPVELAGPPRPTASEVRAFSEALHAGWHSYRDKETGEAAPMESIGSLAEIVGDFAASGSCHGAGLDPRSMGEALGMAAHCPKRIRDSGQA